MRTRALVGGWLVLGLVACGDAGSATGADGSSGAGSTAEAPTSPPTGTGADEETGPAASSGAPGTTTSEAPTSEPTGTTAGEPVCGDGVVEGAEACDDGNAEDRDGCSNACQEGYVPDPVTMGLDLPAVIPVLRVDVGGQEVKKDIDVYGTIEVFEAHAGTLADLDSVAPTLSAGVAFQGRGNFTWTLPKKGYAFELQDAMGDDLAAEIMGLPAGSDFALYACYTDKTCMRNALVFALGQRLGRWSPRTRFVELILNGEYLGLYMLWERVRRDETRCDVDKPDKTAAEGDISGGYIFRHEGGGKGPEVVDGMQYDRDWSTSSGRVYTYHYPDSDKISPEQSAYLRDYVQGFEDAMQADPSAYVEWLDVPSWVDHGIVEELTNNWDGYVHSIYMTKEADEDGGLFGMGPLWDFDLAFANGNVTGYNCQTDNWAHQISRPYPDDMPTYWLQLYADPEFQRAFKCRWQELRGEAIAQATFEQQISAWVAFTAQARARDQMKWATVGQDIFPNCFSMPTYEEEVAGLMTWIDARVAWLDAQTAAMPGACP
ncbi:MAG: CotH kinase family protein [Myxococcales bacterium]|nr:CotH kinase family protein [Myxococcales bacterium]